MATIDDLDREVRRLRKRVNELENAPAAREASVRDAIIGEPERPDHLRGFAAACADSRADVAAAQLLEARRQLEINGLPQNETAFRRVFSAVPGDQLSALFREFQ
jgi:hypothetical protein